MDLSESKELEDFKLKGQLYLEQVKLANALTAEEIKNLRSQEESLEKDNRTIELYVGGALLAYYAWLITHCVSQLPVVVAGISLLPLPWLAPMILPLLASWRVLINFRRISMIALYLSQTEPNFEPGRGDAHIGPRWENYLFSRGMGMRPSFIFHNYGPDVLIWIFLFTITLLAPIVGLPSTEKACASPSPTGV